MLPPCCLEVEADDRQVCILDSRHRLEFSRGEFATAGFRNRDLRLLLYPSARHASPDELRRLCARISRRPRLLRPHGVIHKIPKTHRYRLTESGQLLTAALFATREANIKQLLAKAS